MSDIRSYIERRSVPEDRSHSTPCWIWQGCVNEKGYARDKLPPLYDRTRAVHRASYEAYVEPIPEGLQIDHLCCVTSCVNPDHLEPVTQEENLRRQAERTGLGDKDRPRPAKKYRPRVPKTRCSRGHEYTPENTKLAVNGGGYTIRLCRTCLRVTARRKKLRRKERRTGQQTLPAAGEARRMAGPSCVREIAPHRVAE